MGVRRDDLQICYAPRDHHCPRCRERSLHQLRVTIGFRRAEDEKESLVTVASPKGIATSIQPLPERRDWMEIEFECEHCHWNVPEADRPPHPRLRIYQHKGTTVVAWESGSTVVVE